MTVQPDKGRQKAWIWSRQAVPSRGTYRVGRKPKPRTLWALTVTLLVREEPNGFDARRCARRD